MTLSTVLINGDGGWNFRDILLLQSLDLYRLDAGVRLIDVAPPNDDTDLTPIWGNFPEDFSGEPTGLLEEVKTTLIETIASQQNYLALAIVLSWEDAAKLCELDAITDDPTGVSQGGRLAIQALRQAVTVVSAQTSDANRLSPVLVQIWLSVIIREEGHSDQAERVGDKLTDLLGDKKCPVHNVFYLSNGMSRNATSADMADHMTKLRIVLDMFGDADREPSQIWKRYRATKSSRLDAKKPCIWVQRPEDGEMMEKANGPILLHALFDKFNPPGQANSASVWALSSQSGAFEQTFDPIMTEVGDLTAYPDCKDQVIRDAKGRADNERLDNALSDFDQIEHIIKTLERKKTSWILHSAKRARDFETAGVSYEAAFVSQAECFDTVVDQRIKMKAKEDKDREQALSHQLVRLVLPTDGEPYDHLENARKNVRTKLISATKEIDQSRSSQIALSDIKDQGSSERRQAFGALKIAEDNLLQLRALRSVLAYPLIALLPVVVDITSRAYHGDNMLGFGMDFVGIALGPLLYLWPVTLALSLFAGIVAARRLVKKRNRVLSHLVDRLSQNWQTLQDVASHRWTRAANREYTARLGAVRDRLETKDNTKEQDLTKRALKRLDDIRPHLAIETSIVAQVAAEAMDAFDKEDTGPARIQAFASAYRPPPNPSTLIVHNTTRSQNRIEMPTQSARRAEILLKSPNE